MWTGLKKCMPITFCGRVAERAISVIDNDEVLVAQMQCGASHAFDSRSRSLLQIEILRRGFDNQIGRCEISATQQSIVMRASACIAICVP